MSAGGKILIHQNNRMNPHYSIQTVSKIFITPNNVEPLSFASDSHGKDNIMVRYRIILTSHN